MVCPSISSVTDATTGSTTYIVGAGDDIAISGAGFCATSGCNSVTINGVGATVVTYSRSSSGLKVKDPGLNAGANHDVAVTQGSCAVAHGSITYQNPVPTVTGVQAGPSGPNWGSTVANGTYALYITGTNFVSGAMYSIAGFYAGATTFNSSTSLTRVRSRRRCLAATGSAS